MHEPRPWRPARLDDDGRHTAARGRAATWRGAAACRGATEGVRAALGRGIGAALLLAAFALGSAQAQGGVIQVIAQEGAMVFVDGVFAGTTTASQGGIVVLDVTPGTRAVRVVLGADVLADGAVEVAAGGVATLTANARPSPPEGAGAPTPDRPADGGADGGADGAWSLQFGSERTERVLGLAIGPDGSVAVAGPTTGALLAPNRGGNDVFVRVFDPGGAVRWEQQFGSESNDVAHDLAVDASGHLAVVGYTAGALTGANAGDLDAFIRVYGPSGDVLWEDQFGGERRDIALGVAFGPGGRVAVVGRTNGPLFGAMVGSEDAFVRVYRSQDGTVVWEEQFGSAGSDGAYGVAFLDDGTLVTAGYVGGHFVVPRYGGFDAFIRAYDAGGAVLWQDQFGSVENDIAYAVATDGRDRVTVVGGTDGSLFNGKVGSREPFVRTYDTRGRVLFHSQLPGTEGRAAYFGAVAYDGAGNVLLGGGVHGDADQVIGIANSNLYRRLMDRNHRLVWQDFTSSPGTDFVSGVAVDPSGRMVFAGEVTGDVFGASAGGRDAFVQVMPAPEDVELVPPR